MDYITPGNRLYNSLRIIVPSIEMLIAFTAAALIMNISPGPSNLYVMARAIAQGTKAEVAAAAGLALGSLFHVIAAVFGLSAIFSHSPTLYTITKLVGAGYLIYLGVSYLRSKSIQAADGARELRQKPLDIVFRESVVVEITNPKTALFFIAFLPQFVVPETGSVSQQLLVFGIIVTISALPCDLLVAFSSSKVSNWLMRHEKAQIIQERVSGTILFGMGTYIVANEAVSIDK